MLTQASDYRYCSPIAAGITGEPFPIRDGTPSGKVVRYEDLVFLLEMYCERLSWVSRDETQAQGFAAGHSSIARIVDRVVNTHTGLYWLLLYLGGHVSSTAPSVGRLVVYAGSNAIAANWNFGIAPIFREHPYNWDDWFASMKPALRTISYLRGLEDEYGALPDPVGVVPVVEEADTLRMIHSDLEDIKRYLFRNHTVSPGADYDTFATNVVIGNFDGVADAFFGPVFVGKRTLVDGDYSAELDERYWAYPWRGETYDHVTLDATSPIQLSLTHSESQIRFYIKSPYFINPLTSQPYYTRPVAYAEFSVEARWHGEDQEDPHGSVSVSMMTPLRFALGASPISLGPFEGVVTLSKDNVGMELATAYQAAKNWAQSELNGFEDNSWSLSIQLSAVYLDTGTIIHNASIPPPTP